MSLFPVSNNHSTFQSFFLLSVDGQGGATEWLLYSVVEKCLLPQQAIGKI